MIFDLEFKKYDLGYRDSYFCSYKLRKIQQIIILVLHFRYK